MTLAIPESALHGDGYHEKFAYAKALGVDGVALSAHGLSQRLMEVAEALDATGLRVAAIHMGRTGSFISHDLEERKAGYHRLRQAMSDAVDLMAGQVVFVPHFGAPDMPDLTPHRSPIELQAEMMIWLLRVVSDLAYALGMTLCIQPASSAESGFINTVGQAARFCHEIKDHPHIRIAPNLSIMAHEESDLLATLRDHAALITCLHVGTMNPHIAQELRALDFSGWLILEDEGLSQVDIHQRVAQWREAGF